MESYFVVSIPPPGDYFATEAQNVPTPTSMGCISFLSTFIFNLRVAGRDQVSGRTQAKTDESAMTKREKGKLVSGEKEGRKGIKEV
jgi:hypothetical protein